MNNNDEIFQYNKKCNTSRMRERNEKNKWLLRKINNEIEKINQKFEKNNWEDERYDWRTYLSKNKYQTIEDRNFNVFFAWNQYFFKAKIK